MDWSETPPANISRNGSEPMLAIGYATIVHRGFLGIPPIA